MNYEILNKLVPTRSLPDDASSPRDKLFELFRTLEAIRAAAADAAADDVDQLEKLDKQLKFYEQVLET